MSQLAAKASKVILTEAAVETLVFNAKLQAAAPFIRHAHRQWTTQLKSKKSGCGGCKKNKRLDQASRKQLIDMVRQNILMSAPAIRDLVKELLRAHKVVVPTASLGGVLKQKEF